MSSPETHAASYASNIAAATDHSFSATHIRSWENHIRWQAAQTRHLPLQVQTEQLARLQGHMLVAYHRCDSAAAGLVLFGAGKTAFVKPDKPKPQPQRQKHRDHLLTTLAKETVASVIVNEVEDQLC